MRFLAFLSIVQVLWMLSFAPAVQASDALQLGICNLGFAPNLDFFTSSVASETRDEKIQEAIEKFDAAYTAKYVMSEATCGLPNATGYIEKGDCSTQVITEITEIVSSATPNVEGGEDKIVNVYQGVCCLVYDENHTCYETRTYYTDTITACEDAAAGTSDADGSQGPTNCELRQWLIAETGMGLLKLYVKQIFTYGAFVVGAIAVATIILNGVRISMAGVSGDISEAKQKITQSLSGIVLLFLSALILYAINPDFFG